jgi:hypothetical protein
LEQTDMQRSYERFEISPEAFFDHIDRAFADLRALVGALEARVDGLSVLTEEITRTRLITAGAPAPARWTYDARLPNFLFDDVLDPEPLDGCARRWVGAGGRITGRLRLPRNVQYDLTIEIEDFVSDAAARSFYLRIDGMQYPWLGNAAKRYTSIVLAEEEDADTLAFEIGVDPGCIPPERDVSFSFRAIDIARRQ